MKLIEVEMSSWEREKFEAMTGDFASKLSMTANINVTKLVEVINKNDIKFNAAFCFMVAKIANKDRHFRMAVNEKGNLAYYDYVNPVYVLDQKEVEGRYTTSWTTYKPNFSEFNRCYMSDLSTYTDSNSYFARTLPPNIVNISPNPWVSFTSFSIIWEKRLLSPTVLSGKKFNMNNDIMLPVSLQIDHLAADGYHLGLFFNELQKLADSCEEWIK
ncbi:CatA-like O-acetyltransferase [Salibacterium halotolerans]|uniref:Chloramphenicol O-acetyltransferase type A n=1 Tax=Salibacterium halotolerans TaxID=1884432 RepID=A0A1I5UWK2_9BACI|nr:CatA-like O-acetyltransferase [Salibacterium halotolerans]SFP99598.1 chloramphenicol O-acetyltransferase type A [Salibacterium halotolerans]